MAYFRPLLDYCSPVWNTGFIADVKSLEAVQRRWTRSIEGFSNLPYYERLRHLTLLDLGSLVASRPHFSLENYARSLSSLGSGYAASGGSR